VQRFLFQLILSALAVLAASIVFRDHIRVASPESAVIFALVLGVCNAVVRPVLLLLTFPLTCLSLGLFILVVNALVFWVATIVPTGVEVSGFGGAFLGALAVSCASLAADWLTHRQR
jgi:putative membrane protein